MLNEEYVPGALTIKDRSFWGAYGPCLGGQRIQITVTRIKLNMNDHYRLCLNCGLQLFNSITK